MTHKNYCVRQLSGNDWQDFRRIRLKALKSHPDVYLSRYEDALAQPDFLWREMLESKENAVFGLFHHHQLTGIGAVFASREDRKAAVLAMGYVETLHRRQGLSSLLYDARINWVKEKGCFNSIKVSHREGNEASRRANQRSDFHYTHDEQAAFIDGSARELVYEMRI